VTELVKIEEANVPIMTMKFQGVDVDISFAQLAASSIDENYTALLEDDATLADVDPQTTRSLNGFRVSNMVLKLVPDPDRFRYFLRFVRHWAQSRGLYGNVYGYLGGINCALLCAFICQRYPKAAVSTLILMLFGELSDWHWPDPIYINTPSTGSRPSWDNSPGSPGRRDLMPIITPAYPCQNSLKSATKSTRARLIQEFRRGYKWTRKVMFEGEPWLTVTQPSRFFTTYRKYVQILVWADTKEDFNSWIGAVESRVRRFSQELEVLRFMNSAVPWPEHYDHPDNEGHEFAGTIFLGIDFAIPPEESVDRRIDISEPCQRFMDQLYHDRVRNDHMFLFVKVLARESMPEYLFPQGRPLRRTKKF
jgi:poly(A) polymerase